eukprot:354691-Chlamydomonas_euryale.AAC.11
MQIETNVRDRMPFWQSPDKVIDCQLSIRLSCTLGQTVVRCALLLCFPLRLPHYTPTPTNAHYRLKDLCTNVAGFLMLNWTVKGEIARRVFNRINVHNLAPPLPSRPGQTALNAWKRQRPTTTRDLTN